jgi:hypothetical protein
VEVAMKRVNFIGMILFITITFIFSGCSNVKKAEKEQAKEVAKAYIELRYNQNYKSIDSTQDEINKLWAIEVASDNNYLKNIKYESKLKSSNYMDIDKSSVQRDSNNFETLVLDYKVSYKENSNNIKEELKNTIREDNIQVTMFQKEGKWLIGEVRLMGSKNVVEADNK